MTREEAIAAIKAVWEQFGFDRCCSQGEREAHAKELIEILKVLELDSLAFREALIVPGQVFSHGDVIRLKSAFFGSYKRGDLLIVMCSSLQSRGYNATTKVFADPNSYSCNGIHGPCAWLSLEDIEDGNVH